jgi:glucose/arabinose dehydrogenase
VNAFARDLRRPIGVAILPSGDVVAIEAGAEMGSRLVLLRDPTGRGEATERRTLLESADPVVGVGGDGVDLYVATARSVQRCRTMARARGQQALCKRIAAADAGREFRGLEVAAGDGNLYVLEGPAPAPGDTVDRASDGRLLAMHADGSDGRVISSRVPTSAVFAIDSAGGGEVWLAAANDEGIRAWRPAADQGPAPGAATVRVAAAAYYSRDQYPRDYRRGLFIAWRPASTDNDSAQISFIRDEDASVPRDTVTFLSGLAPEGAGSPDRHRPPTFGVAVDGTLIVADAARGVLWRVRFKCAACTPDPVLPKPRRRVHPASH